MDYRELLVLKPEGLYCPLGNFYIDALYPVDFTLITHAHGDHARRGSKRYLSSQRGLSVLSYRLGKDSSIDSIEYGEKRLIGNVWVSFHPAGHILGSSQIRIEYNNKIAVVSGDYKRTFDLSCDPFEVVPCDLFVTESTFALPIYQWPDPQLIKQEILNWWQQNIQEGFCSVLYCYSLGKAQRILNLIGSSALSSIYLHGSVTPLTEKYEEAGITLAPTQSIDLTDKKMTFQRDLILAPLSASGTPWMKRFFPYRTACASGWMSVRGTRRRMNYNRGFVLSDHADWSELLQTIRECQATNVWVTHGAIDPFTRYLNEEMKLNAEPLGGYSGLFTEDTL